MRLHIVISERAEKNLDKIVAYLEKEWSERVKQNFILKLSKASNQIADNPMMYPASAIKKDIRKCVVTKHTILYYKVSKTEMEIITIQDSRQNPAFLKL
jgi:plasmid stabilization system protein ParE